MFVVHELWIKWQGHLVELTILCHQEHFYVNAEDIHERLQID